MIKIQNFINGRYMDPVGGEHLDNYEPAKGRVYSTIPRSGAEDVKLAADAAKAAFPEWSSMRLEKRSKILYRLSELIDQNLDRLAEAESRDNGKPLWLAKEVDIPRARDNFRFFATAIQHFASESHRTSDTIINYTTRKPIGVAGCISPWNLPLYLFSWKVAPALAAGNTVVAKPSEVTPMTAYLLGELCNEAGMPAGVFNIVHGLGAEVGNAMVEHPDIPMISFTGGTVTGATIARTAAPMFKKLSLELGGKNPNIIFDDCDFDKAIATSLNSSFANQGQICLCGSRMYIQRGIYERFRDEFVRRVSEFKVGDPMDENNRMGALVSQPHFEKVKSYIQLAQEEGGRILTGGEEVKLSGEFANGWFLRPTVIEGLHEQCRTNQEEIFGPVVTLQPFDTEEEAIALANSTTYGLAATVWTENVRRAHRVADQLKSGIVWVNCWLVRDLRTPFGGVKSSGVGREGGWEALRFFTEPKNICIKFD
ncbi:MAG: aldehyde dehydrogenase [Flavobacteriales bacterium]|nr:aldehyde dehydrogenase [Bacteroidota bacterium]MCB9240230.1 aldehyde dehydrogenase [Flavobacteriales bacterium]